MEEKGAIGRVGNYGGEDGEDFTKKVDHREYGRNRGEHGQKIAGLQGNDQYGKKLESEYNGYVVHAVSTQDTEFSLPEFWGESGAADVSVEQTMEYTRCRNRRGSSRRRHVSSPRTTRSRNRVEEESRGAEEAGRTPPIVRLAILFKRWIDSVNGCENEGDILSSITSI